MDNGEIESADEEMPAQRGRPYSPVTSHDRSVIEMFSLEAGSPSEISLKYIFFAFKDLFILIYFSLNVTKYPLSSPQYHSSYDPLLQKKERKKEKKEEAAISSILFLFMCILSG